MDKKEHRHFRALLSEQQNGAAYFSSQASQSPEELALWIPGYPTIKFGDLLKKVEVVQSLLKRNSLVKGDSVLVFAPLSPELFAAVLAIVASGATCILVEPWMPLSMLNQVITSMSPKAFVTNRVGKLWGARMSAVRQIPFVCSVELINGSRSQDGLELVGVSGEDPALIAFTTGTSGQPKGVVRTHGYLAAQRQVMIDELGLSSTRAPDLCIFPNFALANLSVGRASILLNPKWQRRDFKMLAQLSPSQLPKSLTCGPGFLQNLMIETNLDSLEHIHIGGALSDCRFFEKVLTRYPQADIFHIYGSSEAEPVAKCSASEALERSLEAGFEQVLYLGKPVGSISLRSEPQSLWVSGDHVCPRYIADEKANQENKHIDENGILWHRMGDRINFDADGALWYQGRDFQTSAIFACEQRYYSLSARTDRFLYPIDSLQVTDDSNQPAYVAIGPDIDADRTILAGSIPEVKEFLSGPIIRDRRHKSRIDRQGSFLKATHGRRMRQFVKERLPLLSYSMIAVLMTASGAKFGGSAIAAWESVVSFIGILGFFVVLRLMDELKDYQKDKIAHPLRPLPRGLVTTHEIGKYAALGYGFLVVFAGLLFCVSPPAMVLYALAIFWLGLMYKEFFCGEYLSKSPFLYALSHQVVMLPLVAFCVFMGSSIDDPMLDGVVLGSVLNLGLVALGGFFSYEVCRKLDPGSHPILATYAQHYGRPLTVILVAMLLSLAAYAGYNQDWHYVLWPIEALLMMFLLVWAFKPKIFKLVETLATISLMIHLLIGILG